MEARKLKSAQRKAAHQVQVAQKSGKAKSAHNTAALRKHEDRQRWLEEYRTLDIYYKNQ